MEENRTAREVLADRYLREHKIHSLFNKMLASLVFIRPTNPRNFMVDYLKELKTEPPCLFDKDSIKSLFHIMDPIKRGFITHKQYIEAMKTLHIQEYPEYPPGYEINRIMFTTFESIALDVLHEEWVTVQTYNK